MRQPIPSQLPQHYYLNNFRVLVDFVYQNYRTVLSDREAGFYTAFIELPDNCQQLFIRLLLRTNHYIRANKIHYADIEYTAAALEVLEKNDFVARATEQTAEHWISLYTKSELPPALAGKNTQHLPETDLFGESPLALLTRNDPVYHIRYKDTYQVYSLLFFGNLHQDQSEFVLTDLGVRHYETYLTDTTRLPFKSREQLLAYWQYYLCCESYDQAASDGVESLLALHNQLPENSHNDPVLIRRLENFSNKIARQLERTAADTHAIAIYRTNHRPPARERLARLYAKQGLLKESLRICSEIRETSTNSEELEFALLFTTKLNKKLGHIVENTPRYQPPEVTLLCPPGRLSVERITALHYAKTGTCYYVENSLIAGVFGLAVWDIIFENLPGVFYHPFQHAPSDFHDADFRSRRQPLFDQRMAEISNGNLVTTVIKHFHQKRHINNPLVHWRSINFNLLSRAMKIIPTGDWLNLFEYLLRDIKNHRSGLPDLIYFPDSGGYQLLEVKGPGDKLQNNQRRWMRHFHQQNIRHAVINVNYQRLQLNTNEDTFQLCLT